MSVATSACYGVDKTTDKPLKKDIRWFAKALGEPPKGKHLLTCSLK